MIRLRGSLIFRLWLPFIALVMLFSSAGAFYYTAKQRKVINEKYKLALDKIGMTVTLGVEFSLNAEDFNGLSRTLEFVRKDRMFDYILILSNDGTTGKQEVLSVFPDTLQLTASLTNEELYIFKDFPFTSETVSGKIRVGVATKKVNQELEQLNKPVYWALLLTFLIMIAIVFYIVKIVTRPILNLASTISNPHVSEEAIMQLRESTYGELKVLTDSYHTLKVNLLKEEKENNRILKNLDALVKARTNALEKAQERLTKAQKAALLTSFEYNNQQQEFIFSDSYAEIFVWPTISTLTDFLQMIEPDKTEMIRFYFNDALSFKPLDEVVKIKMGYAAQDIWVRLLCTKTNDSNQHFTINGTIQNVTRQKMAEEQIIRLSLVAELTSNLSLIHI